MVVAALLMDTGMAPKDAWMAIRKARGMEVPDTPEQRTWVEEVMTSG
jgi:hypothetical protein